MISPSPYVELVEIETSTFPLGNILVLLAAPFAVIAGWTLRRHEWRFFFLAMVVVIATSVFVLSIVTWALLLIGFLAGFVASGAPQTRGTANSTLG